MVKKIRSPDANLMIKLGSSYRFILLLTISLLSFKMTTTADINYQWALVQPKATFKSYTANDVLLIEFVSPLIIDNVKIDVLRYGLNPEKLNEASKKEHFELTLLKSCFCIVSGKAIFLIICKATTN